ncbi:VOC family protein [Mesorhizobium sp. NBSH29]|uniref:VOC family protein n=1 Tax=Mesorhizobium sp. NBSH29 TaxID=2654249 RepID=UPI001896849E|nr:VOC family protein [Mesorhizobium sp. NBSH29]QPC87897.1 VOC family protein [Mesorhizobium sp. NBSH29]
MSELPFAATTPIRVGRVGLKARNAESLAAYYRHVIGLVELSRNGGTIELGAGERPLLSIEANPLGLPDDPRSAGLFHTAFLMPTRADLARWIGHAMKRQIAIEGASDHLVSEALYLTDPEGNGIEIYSDRPKESWPFDGNSIVMATNRLDIEGVIRALPEGDAGWRGAPDGSVIGHVHLRVGDAKVAEDWWQSQFGLDTMAQYGADAVFLGSGGYHHHVGANAWRTRGAGPRDAARNGLSFVEMQSETATTTVETTDPWGTAIRTVPA